MRSIGNFSRFPRLLRYCRYSITAVAVIAVLVFYGKATPIYFCETELVEMKRALWQYKWYISGSDSDTCRPFFYFQYHIMFLAFGLNPIPYRIQNLLLYFSLLVFLYYFYKHLIADKMLCGVATLFFALSYLHAEVVPRSVNMELWWTLFGLISLWSFLCYRDSQNKKFYYLSVLSFILSILSKESALVVPFVVVATDCYYRAKHGYMPHLQKRDVLTYIPFFSAATAFSLVFLYAPQYSYLTTYYFQVAPLRWIENLGYLYIYALSPIPLTPKLTVLAAFLMTTLVGIMFYYSPGHRKVFILFLLVCTMLSAIPAIPFGIVPRFLFFPSIFISLLMCLLVFYVSTYFEIKLPVQRYFNKSTVLVLMSLAILLPIIICNLRFVERYVENRVYAGRLCKEIVYGTANYLPEGNTHTNLVYVNLPNRVQSKESFSGIIVAYGGYYLDSLAVYYRTKGFPFTEHIKEVNIPFNLGKKGLVVAWYDLYEVPELSTSEFDSVCAQKDTRVLFFNPLTERLIDITGWTYAELIERVGNSA